jgi:hypothetical protein
MSVSFWWQLFSAFCCHCRTCDGYLLPENSLLEEIDLETTIWRCGRCCVSEPASRVLSVLQRVGVALSSVQKGDPRACERFLKQFAPELHHNHYYLTDVRLALAQLYGQTSDLGLPGISDQDLAEKISLCRQVLTLVNSLVPCKLLQLFHIPANSSLTFTHSVALQPWRAQAAVNTVP